MEVKKQEGSSRVVVPLSLVVMYRSSWKVRRGEQTKVKRGKVSCLAYLRLTGGWLMLTG